MNCILCNVKNVAQNKMQFSLVKFNIVVFYVFIREKTI